MTPMLSSIKSDRMGSVFAHNLYRYRSIWVLYTITMFLVMPFSLLLSVVSDFHSNNLYAPTEVLFHLLALGMSVALPLILFHYINDRQAVDVFHSLPVSRKNLFWGNYFFGLTVLLVPYLLFGSVTLAIQSVLNHELPTDINYPMLLAVIICFYSTMVFIMVNCGTLFESITYFGILQVGYPLFVAAGFWFISAHTYGYPSGSWNTVSDILYSFSPVRQLFEISVDWESYQWWKLLVLLGIAVLSACLGAYLYKKRKSESAGQSFAYVPLFYIGSLLISITAGLGFVMILGTENFPSYIFGILLGLVVYFVLDTIRNRGFRNIARTAMVGGAAAVLIVAFFTASNLTHTFGYETRVPQVQQVKSVALSWNVSGGLTNDALDNVFVLSDRESIEAAIVFHQSIADNIDALKKDWPGDYIYDNGDQTEVAKLIGYEPYAFDDGTYPASDFGKCQVKIVYTLQNGLKLYRQYNNCPFVLTKPLYEIAQSDVYKEGFRQWFLKSDYVDCEEVSLESVLLDSAVSYGVSPEMFARLVEAIDADWAAQKSGQNLRPSQSPKGFLLLQKGLGRDYREIRFPVYLENSHILALLKENGWEFPTSSVDISSAAAYLSKEEWQSPSIQSRRVFFNAGMTSDYGDWYPEKSEIWYDDKGSSHTDELEFHGLSQEGLDELLTMVTPAYLDETPHDVVILGGKNYLVYPQYEERVKAIVESGKLFYEEENVPTETEIVC